jgi:hypothetical protein
MYYLPILCRLEIDIKLCLYPNWFNVLFDDHYENVMNNAGRYVSDGFAGTSSVSGFGGSVGDGYGNYNSEITVRFRTTT